MFSVVKLRSSLLINCSASVFSKPTVRTKFKLPNIFLRKPILIDKKNYKLAYEFKYIQYPAAIIKTRVTYPLLLLSVSPFEYYFFQSTTVVSGMFLGAILHVALASYLSKATNKMVGKIYVNKEGEIEDVLFSSIDQNGRRIDKLHKIDDLMNLEFVNNLARTLGFIKIEIENSKEYYLVNVRNCKIVDPVACDYVFGKIIRVKPDFMMVKPDYGQEVKSIESGVVEESQKLKGLVSEENKETKK